MHRRDLLKAMALRLRDAVRENDLVARLGGDEFVVILESEAGAAELASIAQQLLAAIGDGRWRGKFRDHQFRIVDLCDHQDFVELGRERSLRRRLSRRLHLH